MPWPKGKPRSEESKERISAAQKGRHYAQRDYGTRTCRICGTGFQANSARHWFCSADCKALAHYEMKTGITHDEYMRILAEQGNACAICRRTSPNGNRYHIRFFVDHSHRTGRRRGLLCFNCNRALGLFDDDPERMRRAADYVEQSDRAVNMTLVFPDLAPTDPFHTQ